jgi:hypothetical protein
VSIAEVARAADSRDGNMDVSGERARNRREIAGVAGSVEPSQALLRLQRIELHDSGKASFGGNFSRYERALMPARLTVIVVLIGLSVFINYIDRGNLSTAATLVKNELHLTRTQLGFLLTAFFITYMPMQPVVGWLVDRFTASRVLVSGFVLWSLATILSGFAGGFAVLFACRLLLGLGESVSFPSMSKILAENVTPGVSAVDRAGCGSLHRNRQRSSRKGKSSPLNCLRCAAFQRSPRPV